jgi:hypothetical protein
MRQVENGLLEVAWYLSKNGKKRHRYYLVLTPKRMQYCYFIQHLVQVKLKSNSITV